MNVKNIPTTNKFVKLYVSDNGLVLTTHRTKGNVHTIDGVDLYEKSQRLGDDGYMQVTINHVKYPVHRLVAKAFR